MKSFALILMAVAMASAMTPLQGTLPKPFLTYVDTTATVLNSEQVRLYEIATQGDEVVGARVAVADPEALLAAGARPVEVTLFAAGGEPVVAAFEKTRLKVRSEDDFSWGGRAEGDDTTSMAVVAMGGDVVAALRVRGLVVSLKPIGGGLVAVVRIDAGRFPPEMDPLEDNSAAIPPPPSAATAEARRKKMTEVTTIFAYTPAAAQQSGNILALIQLGVDQTNDGYVASGIPITMTATRIYQTNYTESASFSTDLTRFRTKNDGYMDEVHEYRPQDRANIAHLVTRSGSYCGVASTIMASTSSAFCLTAVNCIENNYTDMHEAGHLQGARHDPATDGSQNPFPHGHGYIIESRVSRTVMAYNQNGETRVLHWSNPSVMYNGRPSGEAGCCDNARVLRDTAETVASWCATGSC